MNCIIPRAHSIRNLLALGQSSRASFHTTCVLHKKKAGRYKPTPKKDFPLTYDMAFRPDQIGVNKSWFTWNTGSLDGGEMRAAETAQEEIFIRSFIHGTWPGALASDVIIKRRANMIILNFMLDRSLDPTKMYFLIGYTEEILSYILKCVVIIEPQTVEHKDDLIFKYV